MARISEGEERPSSSDATSGSPEHADAVKPDTTCNSSPASNSAPNEDAAYDATPQVKDYAVTTEEKPRSVLAHYRPLVPCVLGLLCARASLIVGSYGSYKHTDEGLYTDGGMLIALAFIFLLWLYVTTRRSFLTKRQVNAIAHFSIIVESLSLASLVACDVLMPENWLCRLVVSGIMTLSASLAMFTWLRRARGSSNPTAVLFAFGTLALTEVLLVPFSFMPTDVAYALAALLTLGQFPCIRAARRQPPLSTIEPSTRASGYFGFSHLLLSSKAYLTATAIGIGLMAVITGLMRGYPSGEAIAFTAPTRVAYAALTIAICVGVMWHVISGHRRTMTVIIWVILQALCAIALFVSALAPDHLEYSAVFTTTLNALMVAFAWYVIIAFSSCGWRDAFYYACAGWLVWLGARAVARIVLLTVMPGDLDTLVFHSAISSLLVLSAQAVFLPFVRMANQESRSLAHSYDALLETKETLQEQLRHEEEERAQHEREHELEAEHEHERERPTQKNSKLARIMGLDGNESFTDIRMATMEHNARELGKQFLLTDREIEVVTLYALGFTQKRVAEELYISQGTAHAHIKRIYAKTGLHSRQELLDYLEQYGS